MTKYFECLKNVQVEKNKIDKEGEEIGQGECSITQSSPIIVFNKHRFCADAAKQLGSRHKYSTVHLY